jgi:thiol-disulfide isomerase/thioredoxin
MPEIAGIGTWLNTGQGAALSANSLRGKVILVDFWAYSCINCQRAIPHVEAWYDAYKAAGLEVVGVHAPEYAFERVPGNVASGTRRLGITYPVALDNDYTTWNNFGNTSWPAEYLVDANGEIRHVAIGEGDYANTESLLRKLLATAHPNAPLPSRTQVADTTPMSAAQTLETYLGAERANAFSGGVLRTGDHTYAFPDSVPADEFALSGTWSVGAESLTARNDAAIALNFVADTVYLDVGGTGTVTATLDGNTTTYPVSGAPDIYPIVHGDHQLGGVLRVTLSPGLRAYSFTFG